MGLQQVQPGRREQQSRLRRRSQSSVHMNRDLSAQALSVRPASLKPRLDLQDASAQLKTSSGRFSRQPMPLE